MKLSPLGAIADVLWSEIKHHIKNVKLDNHVVMPNHIHGIIPLETTTPLPPYKDNLGALRFQNQGRNSLSSIVGSYKSAVTKHVHRLGYDFRWQSRYYDHIIRDRTSFLRISKYIENNPKQWQKDEFNS